MDLISRQAAIKLLRGECVAKYPSSFYVGLSAAADELSKLSHVDAVEVVRCKDCVHCGFCGEATNLEVMGFYGYCSRGKRREECG